MRALLVTCLCLLTPLAACGSSSPKDDAPPAPTDQPSEPGPSTDQPATTEPLPGADQPATTDERPTLTAEECEAQGTVVGDIGDGAVHRPDYLCPSGKPPIGTVPSGIEGAVCCPD